MKVKIRKYYSFPTMPDWVFNITKLRNAWWCVQEFVEDFFAKRRVSVKIDPWDTWSMDHELAEIVLPMLVQLKRTKHGAPKVDPQDVPDELKPSTVELLEYQKDGTTEEKFFRRWDYVLDEMIFAFNSKLGDDVWMKYDFLAQKEEWEAEEERIRNGFRLFGKYYQNLWD